MGAADARLDLAEPERLRHEHSPSGLDKRLAHLPDGHPSSAAYADTPLPDDEPEHDARQPERVRPLTDAEHAEHVAEVEAKLDKARAAGLATDIQHTIDRGHEVWSEERELQHNAIIEHLYGNAKSVPCEHRAIVAGGLAGAGKTTVLREYAGIDLGQYLMINPDDIKSEMAQRGMVPAIEGLSPMESTELVHEESSHLAKRLADRALAEGRNVVWDITMASESSTENRLDSLRAAGYNRMEGIFIEISLSDSIRRVDARHREGQEEYRNGHGLGGRFVPTELVLAQADSEWGSQNRKTFETLKPRFDAWSRYDNSIDGRAPELAEARPSDQDHEHGA